MSCKGVIKRARLSGNSYIQNRFGTRAERVITYSKAWHSTRAANTNRRGRSGGPPSLHTTMTLLLLLLLMDRPANTNRRGL